MRRFVSFSFFSLVVLLCFGQDTTRLKEVQDLIQQGQMNDSDSLLNVLEPKDSSTIEYRLEYTNLVGNWHHTNGDLEAARKAWSEMRELIDLASTNSSGYFVQYHINQGIYCYEMIDPHSLAAHIDSAKIILENLDDEEILINRGYRLWELEGLLLKFPSHAKESLSRLENYDIIQSSLRKSIAFQLKNQGNEHDLARTYHRLANTYTDLCHYSCADGASLQAKRYKTAAHENYDLAIDLWTQLYGKIHHERARSLYVKAFVGFDRFLEDSNSLNMFEEACVAFGLRSKKPLSEIAKKTEGLMCLKYYTLSLFKWGKKTGERRYFLKAKELNVLAIHLWDEIISNFKNDNTNRDISIYSINPHFESVEMSCWGLLNGDDQLKEQLYMSLQKCKYPDLLAETHHPVDFNVKTLEEFQAGLEEDELFCEFVPFLNSTFFSCLFISKNEVNFIELEKMNLDLIEKFGKSITEQNKAEYLDFAKQIYDAVFTQIDIENYNSLIVSDSDFSRDIPFEALLVSSPKDEESMGYEELDYLHHHLSISYCLGSAFKVKKKSFKSNLELSVFSPSFDDLPNSELPFSLQLSDHLKEFMPVDDFIGQRATLHNFLSNEANVLHISSHGNINREARYQSKIVLADTVLKVNDIPKSTSAPALVTLNTCNSYNGKHLSGDGIDGFVREWIRKGSRACITNRWEVDDAVSNTLMERFYFHMSKGNSAMKSLYLAQKEIIELEPHEGVRAPYYWAGHKYVGQDIQFKEVKSITNEVIFIILGLLALGSLFWYLKTHKPSDQTYLKNSN